MPKHPTQPLVVDENGVVRFKRNEVVNYLVDNPGTDLNELSLLVARGKLPEEDYMHLMQLVGYSVSGYGDLAYGGERSKAWRKHARKMDAKAAQLWADWKAEQND